MEQRLMERALDAISLQISIGEKRELMRAHIARRINRSVNPIKCNPETVYVEAQHFSFFNVT
jgi:hypothetical protein